MKKFFSVVLTFAFVLSILSACSVQEKMSPRIFFERLSKINTQLDLENSEQFIEGSDYVCFVSDFNSTEYVFQISVNDSGDAEKISLACAQTDKAADFISCAASVVKTYSPNDNPQEIIASLFKHGQISREYLYFETQWHRYTAAASEDGFFFSVESKKLVPADAVELSLKPNDKADF